MATYTMELREIANDKSTPVFGFNYPFYCDDYQLKKEFEELFINRYYFHEIGSETYDRWRHQLKARLCMIMPYYTQLYQTEWHQHQVDMLLSKDLTETTIRELEGTQNSTSSSTDSGTSIGSTTGTHNGTSTTVSSHLEDGVAMVDLESGDKTGTDQTTDNGTSQATSEAQSSSESQGENSMETNQKETITFNSKGNIGVQTPAYAITEWRKIIININEMILNDCKDLFMQIY